MATFTHLTDEQYDAADRILDAMRTKKTPVEGDWSPSRIGRAAKVDTVTARTVLDWMVRNQMIEANGTGAWRKYFLRERDR